MDARRSAPLLSGMWILMFVFMLELFGWILVLRGRNGLFVEFRAVRMKIIQ